MNIDTQTNNKVIDGRQHLVSFVDTIRSIANKMPNSNNNQLNDTIKCEIVGEADSDRVFNAYGFSGKKIVVEFSNGNGSNGESSNNNDNDNNNDNEDYNINRLVMIQYNRCMICNCVSGSNSCKMLCLGHLMGWLFCDTCLKTQRLRKIVLGHINKFKTIPLHWLYNSTNKNIQKEYYYPNKLPYSKSHYSTVATDSSKYLHFFRYSKKDTKEPVHSGAINNGVKITCKNGVFHVPLYFRDNETGEDTERLATLGNIMMHTPGFYEELIRCDNLCAHDDIKIAFSDLSLQLQNDIHEVFRKACLVDPTSFTF